MPTVSAAARSGASLIGRLVGLCAAHAGIVVLLVIILCVMMTRYVTTHFAMTTDTNALLSPNLPWRVRQARFDTAFPQDNASIVVVVDGQTPELSESAAAALAAALAAQARLFRSVERPDGGEFWQHNRLLFASTADVRTVIAQLVKTRRCMALPIRLRWSRRAWPMAEPHRRTCGRRCMRSPVRSSPMSTPHLSSPGTP
jgi:hypothetical protein